MAFVGSGKDALQHLESSACDIVVSDMRMPHMDGIALLREVRRLHPRVVRIVLSGQHESEMANDPSVVQAFLHKPCRCVVLKEAIDRVSRSR
jgi:YesN/AraC family two-component response regulator